VDALDLHVEQRPRIDLGPEALVDQVREDFLVGAPLRCEALLKRCIVSEICGAGQGVGIVENALPDRLDQEIPQLRIGFMQPAPERDPVGLVDDAVGIERLQVAEHRAAHEVAVQGRDAVDPVRPEKRQVPHPDEAAMALVDERDGTDHLLGEGALFGQLLEVQPVDQVDDLHVAR
jgi:hypothetical protein